MDKNSNAFVLLFAIGICVVMATALSATFGGLKSKMEANAEFDRHKNVLIAMGLVDKRAADRSRAEIRRLYEENVDSKVLEIVRGTVMQRVPGEDGRPVEKPVEAVVEVRETEYSVDQLDELRLQERRKPKDRRREFAPIYRALGPEGETEAWAIPISGYGLWSTLYGYLALEEDLNTVKGITFYQHGETPGLGGEVENVAWQESWEGKRILEDGRLVGVIVKKGQVDPSDEFERKHMVDGLSGATITSNGVSRFVESDLRRYQPYFEKLRSSDD